MVMYPEVSQKLLSSHHIPSHITHTPKNSPQFKECAKIPNGTNIRDRMLNTRMWVARAFNDDKIVGLALVDMFIG